MVVVLLHEIDSQIRVVLIHSRKCASEVMLRLMMKKSRALHNTLNSKPYIKPKP